ncbi:MAG: hypothetical protein ATN31_04875, partial [Candidatus Epulonipiscioides saccharophilum]
MSANTFINLEENTSGYSNNGKLLTGHATIGMPGRVKVYLDNLKDPEGKNYVCYLMSKAQNKAVRLGELNSPGTNKQSTFKINLKNIDEKGLSQKDIDGIAIVQEGVSIGNTPIILKGFDGPTYAPSPLIQRALPRPIEDYRKPIPLKSTEKVAVENKSENQPNNQLVNKSENQPDNQFVNKSENQPDNQFVNTSENQPDNQFVNKSENQPDNQFVNKSENQPDNQFVNKFENQPDNQFMNKSENQLEHKIENKVEHAIDSASNNVHSAIKEVDNILGIKQADKNWENAISKGVDVAIKEMDNNSDNIVKDIKTTLASEMHNMDKNETIKVLDIKNLVEDAIQKSIQDILSSKQPNKLTDLITKIINDVVCDQNFSCPVPNPDTPPKENESGDKPTILPVFPAIPDQNTQLQGQILTQVLIILKKLKFFEIAGNVADGQINNVLSILNKVKDLIIHDSILSKLNIPGWREELASSLSEENSIDPTIKALPLEKQILFYVKEILNEVNSIEITANDATFKLDDVISVLTQLEDFILVNKDNKIPIVPANQNVAKMISKYPDMRDPEVNPELSVPEQTLDYLKQITTKLSNLISTVSNTSNKMDTILFIVSKLEDTILGGKPSILATPQTAQAKASPLKPLPEYDFIPNDKASIELQIWNYVKHITDNLENFEIVATNSKYKLADIVAVANKIEDLMIGIKMKYVIPAESSESEKTVPLMSTAVKAKEPEPMLAPTSVHSDNQLEDQILGYISHISQKLKSLDLPSEYNLKDLSHAVDKVEGLLKNKFSLHNTHRSSENKESDSLNEIWDYVNVIVQELTILEQSATSTNEKIDEIIDVVSRTQDLLAGTNKYQKPVPKPVSRPMPAMSVDPTLPIKNQILLYVKQVAKRLDLFEYSVMQANLKMDKILDITKKIEELAKPKANPMPSATPKPKHENVTQSKSVTVMPMVDLQETVAPSFNSTAHQQKQVITSMTSLEPAKQIIPMTPLEPAKQVAPMTPLEPAKQVAPMTPLEPAKQVAPMTPLEPAKQVAPMTPLEPAKQVAPMTPLEPAKQVAP